MDLDVKFGEQVLKGARNRQEIDEIIGSRSVLLLMINEGASQSTLMSMHRELVYNDFIKLSVVERERKQLEEYNRIGLEIEVKQLVAVLRENNETQDLLKSLLRTSTQDPLVYIADVLHIVDKYQSYQDMKSEIHAAISTWTNKLIAENTEFWRNLNDNFSYLFHKRRFRLENGNLQDNHPEIQRELKEISDNLDEKERTSLEHAIANGNKELEDYVFDYKDEKKYADIYDSRFKTMAPAPEVMKSQLEGIRYVVKMMTLNSDIDMLLHLWCLLATSPTYYHMALDPEIVVSVTAGDRRKKVAQYVPLLWHLMYREECSIGREVTLDSRFVMSLRQLEAMDWLVAPDYYRYPPLPAKRHYKFPDYRSSSFAIFRTPEMFNNLLSRLTMDVLVDLPCDLAKSVVITGGLLSLCVIQTDAECQPNSVKFRDYVHYVRREDTMPMNLEQKFQDVLYSRYLNSDLDIAIFATSDSEYETRVKELFDHISSKAAKYFARSDTVSSINPAEDKDSATSDKGDEKSPSGAHNVGLPAEGKGGAGGSQEHLEMIKGDKSKRRIKLPNGLWIEVFHIDSNKRNPMSLVSDFHVPNVRIAYLPATGEVKILPSALWAGWTGLCVDIKYFAAKHSPVDIVLKNINRGFRFLLNEAERIYLGRSRLVLGRGAIARPWRYIYWGTKSTRKERHVPEKLWTIAPSSKGAKWVIDNFTYPSPYNMSHTSDTVDEIASKLGRCIQLIAGYDKCHHCNGKVASGRFCELHNRIPSHMINNGYRMCASTNGCHNIPRKGYITCPSHRDEEETLILMFEASYKYEVSQLENKNTERKFFVMFAQTTIQVQLDYKSSGLCDVLIRSGHLAGIGRVCGNKIREGRDTCFMHSKNPGPRATNSRISYEEVVISPPPITSFPIYLPNCIHAASRPPVPFQLPASAYVVPTGPPLPLIPLPLPSDSDDSPLMAMLHPTVRSDVNIDSVSSAYDHLV